MPAADNTSASWSRPPPGAAASSAGRLAAARGVIESKFLRLGDVLESSVGIVGGLVTELDRLAVSLDASVVQASTDSLAAAAARLEGLRDERGEDRGRFLSLSDTAKALAARITAMQRTMRFLRVFAANIKIAAGGVPGAFDEFGEFSMEITRALQEGSAELSAFSRELDALSQLLDSALAQQAELGRRCASLLPAVPRQLTADAATLAEHHTRLAASATTIAEVARALQLKVGGALGSLQIGDATRQRVEHVETALEILARERDAGLPEGAVSWIRLMLADQLDDTAACFDRDVEKMTRTLAAVAADAQDVLSLRAAAVGAAGRSGDTGVLGRLEASFAEAISLVGDLEAAATAADRIGRTAEETAAALAQRMGAIGRIRTTINHIALNAHLKCCRLGEPGRPLSVIAVELRISADQLGDMAGETQEILRSLAAAGPPASGEAPSRTCGSAGVGALLESAAAPVRTAGAKAGAGLAALAEQGEEMVATLHRVVSELDFQGAISAVLTEGARELRGDLQADETDAPARAAAARPLAEIGRLYTMARERQVQRPFEGEPGEGSPEPMAVELF